MLLKRLPRRLSLVAAIIAFTLSTSASANAPQIRSQAPGYYRMMIGNYEITALLDGTHPFPLETVMTEQSPQGSSDEQNYYDKDRQRADHLLAATFQKVPPEGSINAFLVNTGSKLVLIDTGAGTLYGECCGKLVENLEAAGYKPEQVDEILLTHLHMDHVGGLARNGKRVFPNAIVRANKLDTDYWLSEKGEQSAPTFLHAMFEADKAVLAPYIQADKLETFDGAQELVPGIQSVPAPGHTPGHTAYKISSEGQSILIWGDVVHVAAIQFPEPSVTVKYDSGPGQALATRRAVFSEAAKSGIWIAAAHISFPGFGHIALQNGKYVWVPANYSTNLSGKTN